MIPNEPSRFVSLLQLAAPVVLGAALAALAVSAAGQAAPPAPAAPAASTPAAPAASPMPPAAAATPDPAAAATSREWVMPAREMRRQQLAALTEYGPVIGQAGLYQLPIGVMMDRVVADPTLLAPVAMVLAAANTPEERGAQLFHKIQVCYTCHAVTPDDVAVKLGPRLHGRIGSVAKFAGGTAPFDDAYLAESIKDPMAKIAEGYPPVMPPLPITDEQVADVIAYIRSLK